MLKFFKNFRVNITTRVGLLTGSIFVFTSILSNTDYVFTPLGTGVLIAFQVIALIRQTESTNKDFIKLLNYIRHDDFSNFFHPKITGETFENFNNSLNEVIKQFKEIRAEKEAQYQYLRTVIQYIGIGIISFDNTGKVQLVNNAAKKLFMLNNISHIDSCEACSSEMVEKFKTLKTGEKGLVKLFRKGAIVEVAVRAIELTLQGKEYRLITVQNIHAELEEKELEAWQNLTKVLRHEIMNSITPIVSLIGTMKIIVDNEIEVHDDQSKEAVEDLQEALKTIEKRGNGVMDFVNAYRDFTTIPKPNKQYLTINELLKSTIALTSPELEKVGVDFKVDIEGNFSVFADPSLMEQVLINLIKNASEARSKENPCVELRAYQTNERCVIEVEDNGMGIEAEALSKIFIPFFTTKKAGSGIGLSLSRQIVQMHGGEITVESELNKGTTFRIVL